MAAKRTRSDGTSLVIVESPTKARTISRFLGEGFTVEATIGHVRDLPEGKKDLPAKYKSEPWAYLGVNVERNFEPVYVIPKGKAKQVKKIKELLKQARELYLATDEDREGEAISWHLCQILKPTVPVRRLVFHEITEEAIREALAHPRQIDERLVKAQEARRIVDRLFGYEVSPLLWRKVAPKLSAGRVQSVAVRLIVQRERERMRFTPATYWDLVGTFATSSGGVFQATLVSVGDRRIPSSRDFDPATGRPKDPNFLVLDERQAVELLAQLQQADWRVRQVEDKPYTTRPYPPFTTSTLQQEANRKYGFTAQRTMQAAQSLYENGHITYMRTDSTSLAAPAIEAARQWIQSQYGPEYLPAKPRIYQTKVKNAQEAHEAIRPAGHPFAHPDSLRSELTADEWKLYDLIWKRTIASQMTDARGRRMTIRVKGGEALFEATGKRIEFPGYLRAYVEGSDDPEAELADKEVLLPAVQQGEPLACRQLEPKSHTTQPPVRYSEASLIRTLEEKGIGRPSTYASIIDTILTRKYVFKKGNALVPTWVAFAVCQLLEEHLPDLVDYGFTAEMEDELDAISRGELEHREYLKDFYFGDSHPGLKPVLKQKIGEINARDVNRIRIGELPDAEGRPQEVAVRIGRFGPFVQCGDRQASLPEHLPPDELTMDKVRQLLDKSAEREQPLGYCPETGKPIFVRVGRFGPYVQRGTGEGDEKPQNASLLKGMKPEDVDLETALKLLSLPRHLGEHPETHQPVMAHNGRYGPFIKCGDQTRSLPEGLSPLDVTLEQALELLAQPKSTRRAARSKEPLKEFDVSPVTGQPVRLLDGRYGPYVTDGVTNASLPPELAPEEVTFERALELLAERAARGPARRRRGRRTGASNTNASKKSAASSQSSKKSEK